MIQSQEARKWAMFIHFSQLAGFLIPLAGLIVPILIWQLKKEDMPEIDIHGKIVTNWIISQLIYGLIFAILSLLIIGIFLLIALGIISIIFPIIGGIKASEGNTWKYPLSFTFV